MANKTVNAFLILFLLTRRSVVAMIEERFSSTVNTEKMEVFNFRKVPSPRRSSQGQQWWIIRCLREESSERRRKRRRMSGGRRRVDERGNNDVANE